MNTAIVLQLMVFSRKQFNYAFPYFVCLHFAQGNKFIEVFFVKDAWRYVGRLEITVFGKHSKINNVIADPRATTRTSKGSSKNTKRDIMDAEVGVFRYINPGCKRFIRRCVCFCYHEKNFYNVPLISCSRSIASNSALKFPLPKDFAPFR